MDDFVDFKTSVEEVTAVVQITRELELEVKKKKKEVKPKDVTELLQCHDEM